MRNRTTPAILIALLLAAFGAGGAYAWFTTTGSGSAQASSGTLDSPSIATATAGAGTVALTWSTVTPPAGGTVTYHVTRDGGAPAGDCPTSSSPSAPTSCTDSGLAAGTHSYVVTAVWRSWSSTGASRDVTLDSGAAARLVLSAATASPTAGAADDLTITAKDAADNTVTAYAGDKSLTFGGAGTAPDGTRPTVSDKAGSAANFGDATTITFAGGIAGVSGASNGVMRLYKAGAATLTVTDGTIGDDGFDVTVSPAAADELAFDVQPSDAVAGQSISPAVTVRVDDAFGNLTASSASVSVASSAQTLSGTLTRSAVAGVATFDDLSMTRAGSYTLAASSAGLAGAASAGFTITAAAPSRLAFDVQPSDAVAGQSISPAVTVRVDDAFGNLTASSASVSVASSAQTLSGTLTRSAVAGVATFDDLSMTRAGSYTLAASSAGLAGAASAGFTITAAAPSRLAFDVQPSDAVAGQSISPAVTVRVDDAFGNLTASSASVSVASSAQTLSGTLTRSAVAGVATFDDLSMTRAGSYTLAASSAGLAGAASAGFTITAAASDTLAFTTAAVSGQASSAATLGPLTVRRQDQFGNATTTGGAITVGLASNSTGTARFALTSGGAAVTSVSIAAGSSTSAGFFYGDTKAASPTITASSTGLTSATQQQTITGGAATRLGFSSAALSGQASASATLGPLMVQRQDQFGNATTLGGAITVGLASNSTGTARFALTSGGAAVTSVPIASGSSTSAGAFYGDTKAGSPTITATSSGLTAATQQQTITAAAASAMQFVNCSVPANNAACAGQPIEVGNNNNLTFNIRTVDAFANPSSPAAPISITFTNSDSGNWSITAGAPASIASPATQSGQVTLRHGVSNPTNTLTARASSTAIADATLTVKK